MPLPLLVLCAIAAITGAAASKGTAALRHSMNEGETVKVSCRNCGCEGPHVFVMIDRSWAGGAVLGVLGGGLLGTVAGVVAKRVFRCSSCGAGMYENGERPSWNADEAIDAFANYPGLKDAAEELQGLVARNQLIAQRHAKEIQALDAEIENARSDKEALEWKLRALIERLRPEAA